VVLGSYEEALLNGKINYANAIYVFFYNGIHKLVLAHAWSGGARLLSGEIFKTLRLGELLFLDNVVDLGTYLFAS